MDRGMSVAQIVKLCYEMVDQRFQGLSLLDCSVIVLMTCAHLQVSWIQSWSRQLSSWRAQELQIRVG